jgi:hypothetical protein
MAASGPPRAAGGREAVKIYNGLTEGLLVAGIFRSTC